MDHPSRLQTLTDTLANWHTPPRTPLDTRNPQWAAIMKAEYRSLYETFHEMFPVVQELCELYPLAAPDEQAAVRGAIARNRDALNAVAQWMPVNRPYTSEADWRLAYTTFKEVDYEGWLRLRIVGIALQYNQIDYRDDILTINHYTDEAKKRGIDFEPYRRDLLRLAGKTPKP